MQCIAAGVHLSHWFSDVKQGAWIGCYEPPAKAIVEYVRWLDVSVEQIEFIEGP